MIEEIIRFITDLYDSWSSSWSMFQMFLDGFAEFGLGGASDSVSKYNDGTNATPTTRLLGIIYIIATIIPFAIFVYLIARRKYSQKKYAIGLSVGLTLLWQVLTVNILEVRPGPFEAYERFAYGPMAVFRTVREMFIDNPVEAFTIWVVVFGSFFAFSFLMWYLVNFTIWVITTFRQNPLFTETSAKALALWLTFVWIFYLTMDTAGDAFLNTFIVLLIILMNRSWSKNNSGSIDINNTDELIDVMSGSEENNVDDEDESEDIEEGELKWV